MFGQSVFLAPQTVTWVEGHCLPPLVKVTHDELLLLLLSPLRTTYVISVSCVRRVALTFALQGQSTYSDFVLTLRAFAPRLCEVSLC